MYHCLFSYTVLWSINFYLYKWINRRERCGIYLRKLWRLLWASVVLNMKEELELSACQVAFISCRTELRVKLAGATQWDSVVWGSKDGEREGKVGWDLADIYDGRLDYSTIWYTVSNWHQSCPTSHGPTIQTISQHKIH